MLYSRLSWLFYLSADHDGPPTQGMLEVAADLEQQLTVQGAALASASSLFVRVQNQELAAPAPA